jgi:hypothetical protein
MFEVHYNNELEAEVLRLETKKLAMAAEHHKWDNACEERGCQLQSITKCEGCV